MASAALDTVLYVSEAPFFSGAERALVVTVTHVAEAGIRPVVALGEDNELATEVRARGIETVIVPIVRRGQRSLGAWAGSVMRLTALIRRVRPSLVHVNDVPSFQPVGYAARLLGTPIVTHVRFPDTVAGFTWMLKPGLRRALFVSEALRQEACAVAPAIFGDRSDVVYDGVVLSPIADEAARLAVRRELGLPVDRSIVALTGQISEVKGIWDFVDAARIMVELQMPVAFAVLGDDLRTKGAVRREMESRVRDAGLAEHFHFLGFRPNAPRLIPAFDIIAVPSHVEPLGNATLEAMAAARPVVGSHVGGIPEMVVDGETGWLSPPRDPATLAARLEDLVRDPSRAAAFGRAGRARAEQVFGVSRHVSRLREIYDRVVA